MDCGKPAAHRFRTRLGFKQHDVILTKKQSAATNIKISFKGENMQTKYSVLGYRIDLYFHESKLGTEIDENGHRNRNIDYEIKAIKQEIDPGKENFDIFEAIIEISGCIKHSSDQFTKQ